MGHVRVRAADVNDGRIERLRVAMPNLPERTIDRDTAVAWMRDGHSLIPLIDGEPGQALLLIEVPDGDGVQHFIRNDGSGAAADALPALPAVGKP